jgi:peptidyl-tRNA hydrolase
MTTVFNRWGLGIMNEGMVHYIVVRRDLPVGVIAAQVTHAAGESFARYLHNETIWRRPFGTPHGTIAVVLEARNSQHLHAVVRRLRQAKVPFEAIREPDAPWDGALMALGVWPGCRASLEPHFTGLDLLKRARPMRRKRSRKT